MNRSNSSISNSTITTTSKPAQIDYFYINLGIAGQIFVLYCIGVHLVYFVLISFVKDLRKKSLFFINHSVVTNLFFPVGSLVFQYFDPATVTNQTLVTIVCSFYEIYWPFSIYTRMYAILLIAIHRYIAVFKIELFKKINSSNVYFITPVVAIWLFSIALSFIFKYAFSTTYSVTFCLNGFSTSFTNSLLNALFYVLFAMVLPATAIVVLYVLIYLRLKEVGNRAKGRKRVSFALPSDQSSGPINKKREMRFANQFILMCLVVVLTVCGIFIFALRGVIPNYFNLFYYWRPVIRCYIMFFSSLIPILSVYFNPFRNRVFTYFVSHSFHTQTNNSSGSTGNRI